MAFDVTPTSGDAPYVFTANLAFDGRIDFVNFSLEFRVTTQTGSCFVGVSEGTNLVNAAQAILDSGTYTLNSSFDVGSCATVSLIIRDLLSGDVFDYANVFIDNT